MIRPSKLEEAALVAAFSLCDTTDATGAKNQTLQPPGRDPQAGRKKSRLQKRPGATTSQIWDGWHFSGDELIDGGGNRYGQSEIRAIFYNRKLLWHYQELERSRRPVVNRDPVQLCFDAVPPAWKVMATR